MQMAIEIDCSEIPFHVQLQAALERFTEAKKLDRPYERMHQDHRILLHGDQLAAQMKRLAEDRGKRYKECTFENYVVSCPQQKEVVKKLRAFSMSKDCLTRNLLIIGPKGTGKDHLCMAIAKELMRYQGVCPMWINGVDLQKRFQIATATGGRLAFNDYTRSDEILWVSDPLPVTGCLSEFQQSALFGLVDERYSNERPIWITMNVADAKEAASRMGSPTVDRLQHDALIVACNWDSYRKPSE